MTLTPPGGLLTAVGSLPSEEAQSDRGELMQTPMQTLTAHLTKAVRLASRSYLPSSPLTGLGRAGELAALHPAFVQAPDDLRGV
jgi:hypothetical protein